MLGICSCCEQKVCIERSPIPRQQELDMGYEDFEISMTYGESINFICSPHDCWGVPCEGSGQIPQAVIKEEKNEDHK